MRTQLARISRAVQEDGTVLRLTANGFNKAGKHGGGWWGLMVEGWWGRLGLPVMTNLGTAHET